MHATLERKELFCGMVDVLTVAITHQMMEEAESLLQCLRALRPSMVELDTFEAWIAMRRGHMQDAVRLLRHMEERCRTGGAPFAKALLSFCLYSVGDPTWRINAQQVIDGNENPAATGLVRLLLPGQGGQAESPADGDADAQQPPPAPPDPGLTMGAFLRA
jgi:type III secretion protein HrpB1